MARTVAIVEDDIDQRENYCDALTAAGFVVTTHADRPSASKAFQQELPNLAILDIMLADELDGGFDLCRELRALDPQMPIIFLTARDSDIDRVSGLRLDAWDYLTKPINLQYLVVRINSLFRIVNSVARQAAGDADALEETAIVVGDLRLQADNMQVAWRNEAVSLTLTEMWIVESLARRPGQVKTYDMLMQVTRQSYVEKNSINSYIRRIRKKFSEIDSDFDRIDTVFGVGYRWKR
ncbi:response regulator transcription factor [Gammaproteobacteria bacterium]|nr:response regulator transcription factor [Gammaproteobacteria bacterium]